MGASEDKYLLTTTSAQLIMRTLTDAGKLFHSVLTSTARCGSVSRVREAASSLALIQSFQSSLGEDDTSLLVANLLGQSYLLYLCVVDLTRSKSRCVRQCHFEAGDARSHFI
jgi:separase